MGSDESDQAPDTPMTETPDVVGLDAVDACVLVRNAGLVPTGPDNAAEPTTGVVLEQVPAADSAATVGVTVILHTDPGPLAPD